MKIENHKQDLFWVNHLKAIATIGVIMIHVSAYCVLEYGNIQNNYWNIGNFYDSIVRFSVPIFVMITGVLAFLKQDVLDVFIKKRFLRIVLPFLFWNFIYMLFFMLKDYSLITYKSMLSAVSNTIINGSSFHFWYIYMILGLYLTIPIIRPWIIKNNQKEILFFISIWLVLVIFNYPILENKFGKINFPYFSGYLGFLILGYYLANKSFKNSKKIKLISIIFIFIGFIITFLGTYIITTKNGIYKELFYHNFALNVILVSIGLFLLIKNTAVTNPIIIKIIKFINKYSYGVYLVHILILLLLSKININWELFHPIIGIPITTIICLILSIIIVFLIDKLPLGSYISGKS